MNESATLNPLKMPPDMKLFWGCFKAVIATAFGFIAGVLTSSERGIELGFTRT